MSTDLKSLYSFRVSNGHQESMQPNRRRAAKQIASWVRQGHKLEAMKAEKRTGGKFDLDTETFVLVDKYLKTPIKSNGKTPAVKHMTTKLALRELAAAVKLAQSTEDLTDAHLDAIHERYHTLNRVASSEGYEPKLTDDEDEDETDDNYHGDPEDDVE